jgi:hypothetical protein
VAAALPRKTGRRVKILMTREFKLGAKRGGTIVAANLVLKFQAGAFPGSPVQPGCMCAFAM